MRTSSESEWDEVVNEQPAVVIECGTPIDFVIKTRVTLVFGELRKNHE